MTEEWTSDWEKLFAKLSVDPDYRNELGAALGSRDDSQIEKLLRGIQVQGRDQAQLNARISALKAAFEPMVDVATVFEEPLRLAP